MELRERLRQRSFTFAATVVLVVVMCCVVVWAGSSFSSAESDVNWSAAFALGFFPLFETFAALPTAFSESTTHRDAIARLDDYVEVGGEHIGTDAAESGNGAIPEVGKAGETVATGEIRLSHVSYTYPAAPVSALQEISLSIEPGQHVAVLGRSGAGKTTLARILGGALRPDEGEVEVQGSVGFVGQVPYLFNRTLRDNLTLGVMEADDGRLCGALRSVGLGDRFDELERGLDTVIGETGVGFSGGEAHRIAIARVLLADTPVVIVDEPFSALDPETERGLLDTLLATCADRTLIVVTHHLAQIERFDRVIFIEDARLDLDGSPDELLATSARFRDLLAFDR